MCFSAWRKTFSTKLPPAAGRQACRSAGHKKQPDWSSLLITSSNCISMQPSPNILPPPTNLHFLSLTPSKSKSSPCDLGDKPSKTRSAGHSCTLQFHLQVRKSHYKLLMKIVLTITTVRVPCLRTMPTSYTPPVDASVPSPSSPRPVSCCSL